MGTVTAIGEYDPDRYNPGYIYSPPTTTTTFNTFTLWQPQVDFDSWREAADFAILVAAAVGKVRVRKDGPTWTVSWQASQSTPSLPAPWEYPPPWQSPYTVSWNGETA